MTELAVESRQLLFARLSFILCHVFRRDVPLVLPVPSRKMLDTTISSTDGSDG
jgi:hypothetical protein